MSYARPTVRLLRIRRHRRFMIVGNFIFSFCAAQLLAITVPNPGSTNGGETLKESNTGLSCAMQAAQEPADT